MYITREIDICYSCNAITPVEFSVAYYEVTSAGEYAIHKHM